MCSRDYFVLACARVIKKIKTNITRRFLYHPAGFLVTAPFTHYSSSLHWLTCLNFTLLQCFSKTTNDFEGKWSVCVYIEASKSEDLPIGLSVDYPFLLIKLNYVECCWCALNAATPCFTGSCACIEYDDEVANSSQGLLFVCLVFWCILFIIYLIWYVDD